MSAHNSLHESVDLFRHGPRDGDLSKYPALMRWAYSLLYDSAYFWLLAGMVVTGDAALTQLIIKFVSYTEIDWETYMYHIDLIVNGERNYTAVDGPTGLLVYPAGHVYVHKFLHAITDNGINIWKAQQVYAALYILSVIITCAIYRKAGTVPNWVLLVLPLSKRLHSIYVLRLFNDCWTAVGAQSAILAYAWGWDLTGSILFSLAISVKMSALLYLPGTLLLLWRRRGPAITAFHLACMAAVQVIVGWTFLSQYPWEYLSGAFDFSRVFIYKWTVNWRFVSEETFLSKPWATGLLFSHLITLLLFAHFKWTRASGGLFKTIVQGLKAPFQPVALAPAPPDHVIEMLMTANLLGILFARSLHYQFYSWYAQQRPFLAWRTPFPEVLNILLLAAIEWTWNVFPSTRLSSAVLLGANTILLLGVFFGKSERRQSGEEKKVS